MNSRRTHEAADVHPPALAINPPGLAWREPGPNEDPFKGPRVSGHGCRRPDCQPWRDDGLRSHRATDLPLPFQRNLA
jgi:hypothetical protein